MFSQRDIQITADIRLMALSQIKLCLGNPHKDPITAGMRRILRECDGIIATGPAEYRHVIAETSSDTQIERALRQRAFGERG